VQETDFPKDQQEGSKVQIDNEIQEKTNESSTSKVKNVKKSESDNGDRDEAEEGK